MYYILGVLFVIVGIYMIAEHFVIKSRWTKTTGVVKDYVVKTGPFYTPVLSITYEGAEYTLPAGDLKKPEYEIGQSIPVYFDKTKDYAVIDDGAKQIKNAVLVMLPGIAIIIIKALA
ncbi:MAG: hypothetical protein IJR59_01530 [Firmicutes bacterium]|nr:hypothetical protein [Bacillota bacterium]